jgi:hypothetical protein
LGWQLAVKKSGGTQGPSALFPPETFPDRTDKLWERFSTIKNISDKIVNYDLYSLEGGKCGLKGRVAGDAAPRPFSHPYLCRLGTSAQNSNVIGKKVSP